MRFKAHQISKRSSGRKIAPRYGAKLSTFIREELPEIKPIQGILPDSKEEFWVYLALEKLRLKYIFQYQVMGGRRFRGGQVIDFWVLTVPLPTPLYVQGMIWHYTAEKRQQSRLNIEILKRIMAGRILEPVEVFDYECPNPDVTYSTVRRKLRR